MRNRGRTEWEEIVEEIWGKIQRQGSKKFLIAVIKSRLETERPESVLERCLN